MKRPIAGRRLELKARTDFKSHVDYWQRGGLGHPDAHRCRSPEVVAMEVNHGGESIGGYGEVAHADPHPPETNSRATA